MKNTVQLFGKAMVLALLIFNAIPGQAQTTTSLVNTLSAAEKKDGWKLLFDGKTFNGWRSYYRTDKPSKGWSIEDGCLKNSKGTGRPRSGGGVHLS